MSTSTSLGEIVRQQLTGIVTLTDSQITQLEAHYALMLRWNQRLNLTSITEVREAAIRHYCESLYLAAHIGGGRIVDVGSGPGFPGIPIAILRPDCQVDLVESHARKAVFLREACRDLGNARVWNVRAEDLSERYDWLVARAVRVPDLVKLPLAKQLALLLSEADAAGIPGVTRIALPWAPQQVIAFVSRGT